MMALAVLQLVFDFEAELARIHVPKDELRDPRATYNPHTVDEVRCIERIHVEQPS
jgi:hypothetical protein